MSELKTLKDFADYDEWELLKKEIKDKTLILNKEELRKEAIKWVKELSSILSNGYPITDARSKTYILHNETTLWIKYFFNITDEELN
jgi:hypothetical protein